MIPGGMAATSLYHGIGTSLEALNYAQGAYGLGRLGLGLGRWAIGSLASRALASSEIFFSQSSVRGLEEIAASMQANGWVGAPVDIVSVGGRLVTIDNTRVAAAYLTGTPVQAVVHGMNELLPASMAGRFVSAGGVEATTWGEAIMIRIGAQNAAYRSVNPLGSWFIGVSP